MKTIKMHIRQKSLHETVVIYFGPVLTKELGNVKQDGGQQQPPQGFSEMDCDDENSEGEIGAKMPSKLFAKKLKAPSSEYNREERQE